MQDYYLRVCRGRRLDSKRAIADLRYINAKLLTVSYQASPRGQQLGHRLVRQLPYRPSPSAPLLAWRKHLKQQSTICDSKEFEELFFAINIVQNFNNWYILLFTSYSKNSVIAIC